MKRLKKKIEVELLDEASEYFFKMPLKIQEKFLKSFEKTEVGFVGDWFTKIELKEGIFEFRQRDEEKFYRIFAFWDNALPSKTLILATHGLNKKTNKTPKSDIDKAIAVKKKYFLTKEKIKK
jgi:phage-related protein